MIHTSTRKPTMRSDRRTVDFAGATTCLTSSKENVGKFVNPQVKGKKNFFNAKRTPRRVSSNQGALYTAFNEEFNFGFLIGSIFGSVAIALMMACFDSWGLI